MFLNSANLKRDYRRFPRRHQIASSCSRTGDISRAAPSSRHKPQTKKTRRSGFYLPTKQKA
ncbi:hypothetical protein BIY27_04515 [Gibbsiella quercinecans]|nr:hypothetical protein BIY27_04515 [Gibbsiella quercinecans]